MLDFTSPISVWVWITLAILLIGFLMFAWFLGRIQRLYGALTQKVHNLLQNPTADPIIDFFNALTSRSKMLPKKKTALLACISAFYQTAYGDFEKTRETLSRMETCDSVSESGWHHNQGLLLVLESSDFEQGLEHFRNALKIGGRGFGFEALWLGWCYAVYVMVGELLLALEKGDSRTASKRLKELERRRYVWVCDQVFLKWGLLMAYTRMGDSANAEIVRQWLRENAPYCRGLVVK